MFASAYGRCKCIWWSGGSGGEDGVGKYCWAVWGVWWRCMRSLLPRNGDGECECELWLWRRNGRPSGGVARNDDGVAERSRFMDAAVWSADRDGDSDEEACGTDWRRGVVGCCVAKYLAEASSSSRPAEAWACSGEMGDKGKCESEAYVDSE